MSRDVKVEVTGLIGYYANSDLPIVEVTIPEDAYALLRLGMTVTINIPEAKQ